jgi:hypothetical protein
VYELRLPNSFLRNSPLFFGGEFSLYIKQYKRKNMKTGYKSPKFPNDNVYFLCTGPDPKGPCPGERLIVVIYDNSDNVIRRLEQVKGNCIDEGYVDFFNSYKCRPSVYDYHIIDTDKEGNKSILATHSYASDALGWLQQNFPKWVEKHSVNNKNMV